MIPYHRRKREGTKKREVAGGRKPSLLSPWEGGGKVSREQDVTRWPGGMFCVSSVSMLGLHVYPNETPSSTGLGGISLCCPLKDSYLLDNVIRDNVSSYSTQPTPWRDRASHVLYLTMSKQGSETHLPSPQLLRTPHSCPRPPPTSFLFHFCKTGSCHVTQAGLRLLILRLSAGITGAASTPSFGFFPP